MFGSKVRLSIKVYLPLMLLTLGMLMLSRLGLCLWQSDLIPPGSWLFIFAMGLRYDLAAIAALFALPLLITLIFSFIGVMPRAVRFILQIWCAAAFAFLLMNEAATPGFILEYGVRPNQLYVQYLIYPKEVLRTLWGGHKVELFASLAITLAAFLLAFYLQSKMFARALAGSAERKPKLWHLGVELLVVLCLVPLAIRSTLGHRPLNPAMAAFCDSPLVNSLPVNSSYSASYALAHLGDTQLTANDIYTLVSADKVLAAAADLSAREAVPGTERCPLLQQITPPSDVTAPRNVVIVLEESLGADFVQSLGGLPLTPHLERLKAQGWWFDNLYAAGHRSIRGIEAVSAGFPPSPLESIVKLLPQHGAYATLAEAFKQNGYHTSFIYGGESHFDNMRSYFLGNGMQEVIEQKDYQNPSFVASWGVSDEDLFDRAHESYLSDFKAGKNFFSIVFTSSFHDPFEIPQGKVSLDFDAGDQSARYLAVKYADYALGRFMDKALSAPYAHNTVFLIVADHESKVRAQGTFPLSKFKIPGLIIAPGLSPRQDARIVSQIDLPPTLLALAGLRGSAPFVGENLLRKDAKERALVQYNQIFGLLTPEHFVVLTPRKSPDVYTRAPDGTLLPATATPALIDKAAALENMGPLFYQQGYMQAGCLQMQAVGTL